MNIDELTERIVKFRDERNWGQFHNPKDLAISLALEAAEVLEHFQWKNEEGISKHLSEKKGEVADELVDVLYWVLLMSHDLKIDLAEAFESKMKQNNEKYPVEKAYGKSDKHTDL
jgi:NTP pyrophosphatase (non-canonical NTP hydrolase)